MSARSRQRPRRRRGLLAASFIATFAALPACQETTTGPQFAPNPPAPNPPDPPTATTPAPDPAPSASTKASPPVMNPPAPTASATPDLPPAPNGGRIEHQPDGSCMWYADVHCPKPPATCNPPAPHKVKCP